MANKKKWKKRFKQLTSDYESLLKLYGDISEFAQKQNWDLKVAEAYLEDAKRDLADAELDYDDLNSNYSDLLNYAADVDNQLLVAEAYLENAERDKLDLQYELAAKENDEWDTIHRRIPRCPCQGRDTLTPSWAPWQITSNTSNCACG